jgi:hypothetical protein
MAPTPMINASMDRPRFTWRLSMATVKLLRRFSQIIKQILDCPISGVKRLQERLKEKVTLTFQPQFKPE